MVIAHRSARNGFVLAAALAAVLAAATLSPAAREKVRGEGPVVEEVRSVKDFHGIRHACVGTVRVAVGKEEGLIVRAEENILPHLVTEVEDGVLVVRGENGYDLRPKKEPVFEVTVRALDLIELEGSGSIRTGDLAGRTLTIRLSGSGDIEIGALDADRLDADLAGSGDLVLRRAAAREGSFALAGSGDLRAEILDVQELEVRIAGSGGVAFGQGVAGRAWIELSGSGGLAMSGVRTGEADVSIAGSGSVEINVADRLDARIAGSGDIVVEGDPVIRSAVVGSGEVIRR
ncbi:MAG: DUF2807 domain-containing protein [Candidatus Eisenbacteria bacterium]|nr:DUF2807 domain-containing protein [Candidatus Eisenbacteria bacterium]